MHAPFAHGRPEILTVLQGVWERDEGRDLVLLIDGLGVGALEDHRGYLRALRPLTTEARYLPTILPSTTSSVLTSYFTGLSPLEHGVLGYTTLDRTGEAINQLQGMPGLVGGTWRGGKTHGERARERGRLLAHVGPQRYDGSFLTQMLQPGWAFYGYRRQHERLDALRAACTKVGKNGLVYMHIPELDKAGHVYGPGSDEWLAALEDVDSLVASIMRIVPQHTRITLTSDHGMLRADHSAITDLSESPIASNIGAVAGEGRALMVRLGPPHAREFVVGAWCGTPADATDIAVLREWVGERGHVLDRYDMLDAGVLGPTDNSTHHPQLHDRLGDLLIFATGSHQFTDSRIVPRASLAQRGVHGSVSDTEMIVPLWETTN